MSYSTFSAFYPYYLSEHSDVVCRRFHFVGSLLGLLWLGAALWLGRPWLVLAGLVNGYAFAWIGHFFFEKNRPATFRYPLYSFIGDWRMFLDVLRGQVSLRR